MAKKDTAQTPQPVCVNCKHNLGENERHHYMWYCSLLEYNVVFGLTYCKAEKQSKGKFEPK